ncbi:unnamed protein product [Hymenolepis diminuta]|uniref:UBC core domain-containing protein n=3 Tax=Hymenolepis diminuta TaxID=6216 RepID=A0A564Z517_HYMDI|nr:unnamed protein product [Hymenolepis diminuta]
MAGRSNTRASAVKALQKELKELAESPVEGFKVTLVDESNLFVWDVAIFGPPQTLYEGGYFKARLSFPHDYPYNPPTMRFISQMFHPNIFENGNVCISILHSPGEDMYSDEHPSEQWNPTQSVRTILLSVISLLNEPNINSAAHVDASVAYRKWIESEGRENMYEKRVKELVERTKSEAKWDGVVVPVTLEEYCSASHRQQSHEENNQEDASLLDGDDDYCFCEDYDENYDDMDEMYEEARDNDDEGVACNHLPSVKSPSSSSKPSVDAPTSSSKS